MFDALVMQTQEIAIARENYARVRQRECYVRRIVSAEQASICRGCHINASSTKALSYGKIDVLV
jgi:hypothetical protein